MSSSTATQERRAFDKERFELLRLRSGATLGAPCRVFERTASTNDLALEAARAGALHGTIFVAEYQTQGRGRRGRQWYAEPRANLLFSVILRHDLPLGVVPALALASGLAVRSAVAACLPAERPERDSVRVKWPNDVWVEDRKIAGILAEGQMQGTTLLASVVGIGINLEVSDFPAELAGSATSLALLGARTGREELLVRVLAGLEHALSELSRDGIAAIHADLVRHDALFGRTVRVDDLTGLASGIDAEGRLLVTLSGGEVRPVASGSVELIA